MFCTKCGNKVEDNVKFCPKCGNKISLVAGENAYAVNNSVSVNAGPNSNVAQGSAEGHGAKRIRNILLVILSLCALAAVVVVVIMMFIGKFNKAAHDLSDGAYRYDEEKDDDDSDEKTIELSDGRTVEVSDRMDLYIFTGEKESVIESIYDCDESESGLYPSDDKITFLCMDGYVSTITIRDKDKYKFLGISLKSKIDKLDEEFLEEFSFANESVISDGLTRRIYISENGNGIVNIDCEENKIVLIGWTSENMEDLSVVSEVVENELGDSDVNDITGQPMASEFYSDAKFTVRLPEIYDTEVEIDNGTFGVSFYAIRCKKEAGGLLFSIIRLEGEDELYDYEGFMDDFEILYHAGDTYFVIGKPTDVEFTKETQELYEGLASYYDVIKDSFTYRGPAIPEKSEYIIPGSDSGYFDESVLYGLSADECRLARNEIFARHGKIFRDQELQEYFNSCSWYTPVTDDVTEAMLNKWELANVNMIIDYEKSMGYR